MNKKTITIIMAILFCLQAVFVCPVRADSANTLNPSVETVLKNVGNYILSVDTNPDYSSTWNVLGMVRSGMDLPSSYVDTYYNNTVNYLINNNWQLTRTKYSDYSKLILGMTVIGKDARNIAGHNLLEYLSDFSKIKLQGFNGPIWALIALNCHPDYEIPINVGASEQTTEEGLIQYLLNRETSKGGWTLFGDTPDTDITGMTIQALSSYYGKREDVTAAVDRALTWMSSAQNSEGGYSTLNGNTTSETSESDSQVIVALCSIGIDPGTDNRFIKANGKWVMSRLFEYYIAADTDKGGFMHIFSGTDDNGGGAAGTLNGMATEQGMYATAAYKRFLSGGTALYDMSDITLSPGGAPTTPSTTTSSPKETTSTKKIKITKLVLPYKQITLTKGKSRTLKVRIYPSNATNKKVRWYSSDTKIARVSQKGKIKAVKHGKATITVKAGDGSKKKTSCKVIVKAASSGSTSSSRIKVTDVNLNYSQISLKAGASRSLSVSVSPSNASNKRLSWYSSNSKIASVNGSGKVTGKKSGKVTVTAKAKDGSGEKDSCTVIVYGSTGSGSSDSKNTNRQASSTSAGNKSSSGEKNKDDSKSSEATTEASAWAFDGDTFVPETKGEGEDAEDEEDALEAEYSETEDEEEKLPLWLSLLIGFAGPGALAGSFRVPWKTVKAKAIALLVTKIKK